MSRQRQSKSAAWRRRQAKDPHVRAAKQAGYRSRSAYKLLEINTATNLLFPNARVIDLGAAPGGWSQVAATQIGNRGTLIAVDILPIQPIGNATVIRGDFTNNAIQTQILNTLGNRADVILSDMSPNLTGINATDQAQAVALGAAALEFAECALQKGGAILVKAFEGEERKLLDSLLQNHFAESRTLRPKATRTNSREIYLLGKDFLPKAF